jgi:importin-5
MLNAVGLVAATSAIEDKRQAFKTLVIYCSTLSSLIRTLFSAESWIDSLSLRVYFHDGVREACAMYVFPLFYFISNHIS